MKRAANSCFLVGMVGAQIFSSEEQRCLYQLDSPHVKSVVATKIIIERTRPARFNRLIQFARVAFVSVAQSFRDFQR